MKSTRESHDYNRGYDDGYKEGFNAALREFIKSVEPSSAATDVLLTLPEREDSNG